MAENGTALVKIYGQRPKEILLSLLGRWRLENEDHHYDDHIRAIETVLEGKGEQCKETRNWYLVAREISNPDNVIWMEKFLTREAAEADMNEFITSYTRRPKMVPGVNCSNMSRN